MGEKSIGEKADIPGGVSRHNRGLQSIKPLFDSLVKISLLSGHLLKPLCSGFLFPTHLWAPFKKKKKKNTVNSKDTDLNLKPEVRFSVGSSWRPLSSWCQPAFWKEGGSLAWFPHWLSTACWYLLFSALLQHLKTLWSQICPSWCLTATLCVLLYLRLKTPLRGITPPPLGVRLGEEIIIVPFLPPHPCLPASLTVLNFLFDLAIKSLPFFVSDVCRARLGKWLAEEDVWENAAEQAITFDKAIVPAGEEEESQRIRALLLMKNAMQEGASLWSLPVKPTLDCTNDSAFVHQAFALRTQRTDLNLGYHALPLWRISLAGSLSLRRQWLN